ncbi:hypothetical protein BGZ98_004620 [Dissophora globulifera]|nr:hypothetical protein BGZ98_004620 [Dissophora globulifera]
MAPSTTIPAPAANTPGSSTGAGVNSQHSLRQLVRDQITEYSRLTQSLFAALDVLVEGKAAPVPPNVIMKQIVQLDSTLMGAVEKIELHQRQQQRIRQVREEIEDQNKAIMAVVQNLIDAKKTLEASLEDQDQKQAVSADARSAQVSVSEIVAYANRLSNYTSAPPNFNPQDPNHPFEPPYPREVSMRAGILNQQHIAAAALVSLDGGFMPGYIGQAVPPQPSQPGQQPPLGPGQGVAGAQGIPSSMANHANADAAGGAGAGGAQRLANGGHVLPHEIMMMDDDDDSGSSSDEEGFSLYDAAKANEENDQHGGSRQGQQGLPHEDEADIFDLDLN